jgi:hypothetical protein
MTALTAFKDQTGIEAPSVVPMIDVSMAKTINVQSGAAHAAHSTLTPSSPHSPTTVKSSSILPTAFPELSGEARVSSSPIKGHNSQTPIPRAIDTLRRAIDYVAKLGKHQYIYFPIRNDQIRVLIIMPGQEHEEINAFLGVANDSDLSIVPYKALSYCWGKGQADRAIIVHTSYTARTVSDFADVVLATKPVKKLRRLYVRPNLHEALQRLRDPSEHKALWVDAICINQNDDAEKTVQMMKMNMIYQSAFCVCIWLGPDDQESYSIQAMQFIKRVIDLQNLGELLVDDNWIPQWLNLFQLLKRGWFSRRWVIQELAMAEEATVHCGKITVHWNDFRDAISIFH